MKKYSYNDIVYLLDDVVYNKEQLKRGQEFFVIRDELNRVECFIDGNDKIYVFTKDFVTDNPSDILWSKAFFRVFFDNLVILTFVVLTFIIVLGLLFN